MGISLLNTKMICRLPITRMPYDEFVPSTYQLQVVNKEGKRLYPCIVSEFLLIHTELRICIRKVKCRGKSGLPTFTVVRNDWGLNTASALFPIHLPVGWLGEHFPALYRHRLDLNSQLQELENRKTIFLKEEARIQAKMLQVEDRYGALTSNIVDLEKSLEQEKKDE
ncbi:hypothetical protein ACH5RR_023369 [Cinchona calisaya]|uniref:Uncharacterized protein n=1 Tax=Cinchona calisaya TaxID=153742 RepID=A0ABD2ZEC7_9GENT